MRQRRGMKFMGNSYMDWRKKGKGFFHAKVAKGAKKLISARVCFA